MRPSSLLPVPLMLLIFLLQHQSFYLNAAAAASSSSSSSKVVEMTCETAQRKAYDFDYNYCVRTLKTDPKSEHADVRGLAFIATNLTAANVSETLFIIKDLVGNLNSCLRYYSRMSATLSRAMGAIRTGDAAAASGELHGVLGTPDDCDIILFEGQARKDPLYDENIFASELVNLAMQLTDLLPT